MKIPDYHIHTHLCGHASGQPFEYVQHALSCGLQEIGFSDHAPFVSHEDPGVTMNREQLPLYHQMIKDLQGEYKDRISIKLGIEADYMPGFEDKTKELLDGYSFDYVMGSVHFIGDWGFDNPCERPKWDKKNYKWIYKIN